MTRSPTYDYSILENNTTQHTGKQKHYFFHARDATEQGKTRTSSGVAAAFSDDRNTLSKRNFDSSKLIN